MYTIEKKYINTNSMTVATAESYYGRKYVVTDYFTHWWDRPTNRAKSPMDIYNYMVKNNKSVRHILGWDDALKKIRIIAMTPENRVPLTQQNGNIYGDSVEVDPLIVTSDPRAKELYKALGWLMWQREKRWGRKLRPRLHKEVWATACSDINKARVQQERDKWAGGGYNEVEDEMLTNKSHLKALTRQFLGRDPDAALNKYLGKSYAYTVDKFHKARKDLPTALKTISDQRVDLAGKDAQIVELKKQLEEAKKTTRIDIGDDTRNWVQKIIDSLRGK